MPSEEYEKRKREYIKRYQRKTYVNISFKVRIDEDHDIIEKLNSVPNKSEYIKDLIRKN